MKLSFFLLLSALSVRCGFAAEGLPAECDGVRFIVPPCVMWQADETFRYAREPLLARMQDGSLICALYTGGRQEPDTNNVVAVIRSYDDGKSWSDPQVIFAHPHRACWATELNTLGRRPELVFQTFDAHTYYAGLRPYRTWTDDSGKTWSRPVSYSGLPQSFTTRQGLRLSDGALLHPIYWLECEGNLTGWISFGEPNAGGTSWCKDGQVWFGSGVIRSDDDGVTWSFASVPQPASRKGRHLDQWEPAVVELSSGVLKLFARVESEECVLWESESSDGGRTWTRLHPGEIANPGTKMQVLSRKGDVVLFNNTCARKHPNRYRLEAMISSDSCRNWRRILLADSSESEAAKSDWFNGNHVQVAYPSAILDESRQMCYLAIDSVCRFYLLKIPFKKLGW